MTGNLATVATIIVHTPIWVWPLYALLLFLGFQRTRDSSLPVWRLLILPTVVAVLATLSAIGNGTDALPATFVGLVIGGTAGWLLDQRGATRRLPDGRLWLRGEWWSFAQIAVVLVFRYATSIVSAMDHSLSVSPVWHLGTALISAGLSAMFLGRTAARLRTALGRRQTV